jgi:hypothetical protein
MSPDEFRRVIEVIAPDRPDNLFQPAAGGHGAHGANGEQAKNRSWQLEANLHRGVLAAAIGAIVFGVWLRRR